LLFANTNVKRPGLEANPSLPRYRRHFVVRGQSKFGVALQETIGGVLSMLMPLTFADAELEVQRMAYDCGLHGFPMHLSAAVTPSEGVMAEPTEFQGSRSATSFTKRNLLIITRASAETAKRSHTCPATAASAI
jgi:hypothetical protein